MNACASFEDVNTAVHKSAGAARPNVVVVVSDDDDDKEDENGVDEYGINFNKPLLQQVPFLKEKYFEWTHIPEPSRADGTQQRFFEADWMEALSVTAWYVVLLIWLPVIVWNVIKGAEQSSERCFRASRNSRRFFASSPGGSKSTQCTGSCSTKSLQRIRRSSSPSTSYSTAVIINIPWMRCV